MRKIRNGLLIFTFILLMTVNVKAASFNYYLSNSDYNYEYVDKNSKAKSIKIIGSDKNQYIKKMEVDGVSKVPQTSVSTQGIITFDDSKTEHSIDFWFEIILLKYQHYSY